MWLECPLIYSRIYHVFQCGIYIYLAHTTLDSIVECDLFCDVKWKIDNWIPKPTKKFFMYEGGSFDYTPLLSCYKELNKVVYMCAHWVIIYQHIAVSSCWVDQRTLHSFFFDISSYWHLYHLIHISSLSFFFLYIFIWFYFLFLLCLFVLFLSQVDVWRDERMWELAQNAGAVWVHEALKIHPLRTLDPSDASFFFIPVDGWYSCFISLSHFFICLFLQLLCLLNNFIKLLKLFKFLPLP